MASVIRLPAFVEVPNWAEQIDLDGQPHTLQFRWNSRERHWYVHLLDEFGLSLRSVQKLVPVLDTGDSVAQLLVLAADDIARGDPVGTAAKRLSLFPAFFTGLLWVQSGSTLRRRMDDLSTTEILYLDADALASLRAYAESLA